MTISSVSSNNALLKQLEANGLSADKAKLVEKDLESAQTASSVAVGSAPATISSASVRAALDTKIDADVTAGKLSASDAATIKKTLDDIDGQTTGSGISGQATVGAASSTSANTNGGTGGSGTGGGGGGSGSATKTELSETITVVGSTKTTTITYTDNTTTTTTTTATDADKARYEKTSPADATNDVAQSYLSTIEPGTLIDQTA